MSKVLRKRILIKGVVQGVGFRPHVYRLALERRLSGWVKNDASGVTIEAQGPGGELARFIKDLETRKPPAARIDSLTASAHPSGPDKYFAIIKSGGKMKAAARIPADLALCADCRRELLDPSDRRYLYPFTNCTNCGPRFTIVKSVPYDRPLTTMKSFKMCPACLAEYRDPLDRRFHAQPNACPVCGPKVSAVSGGRKIDGLVVLERAAEFLMKGRIVALQSLGGFHLACDAGNAKAVSKLRRLKDRPAKPFAVMTDTRSSAESFCFVSGPERRELESVRAPVVMLKKRTPAALGAVAPGLDTIGVMLAYTPLHAALFRLLRADGFNGPLVMTSGNRRDEPISRGRAEAEKNLGDMSDFILFHDREIHNRIDDSVGFYAGGAFRLVRRARGYVPDSVRLGGWAAGRLGGKPVLGCGADLKSVFCLIRGGEAFLSQYIGDQSEYKNQGFYAETLAKTKALLQVRPGVIAHDLHPDYHSSNYARGLKGVKVAVQHHVAHVLSVAAEQAITGPFIGAALDGTGYGTDGNIWGSEFFVINKKKGWTWRRAAHLKYFALPGGDAAAAEVWRSALSLVMDALGPGWRKEAGGHFRGVDSGTLAAVEKITAKGVNAPLTSSMGRLFDAMSFLAGLGAEATYEGQLAMELESLAVRVSNRPYIFELHKQDGIYIIDPAKAVLAAVRERGGVRAPHFGPFEKSAGRARIISERFHSGLADILVNTAAAIRRDTGITTVVLSGGVFQNRTLLSLGMERLEREGFKVFTNEKVPANDGGIALGQVYYALKGFREQK
jgi:hydrogenase maturation protein HypF